MANPIIRWTLPLEVGSTTSSPGESPGDPAVVTNNYVSISDPHILRNDLVTISRKAPTGLIDANGRDIGGTYFARFNDVDRTIVPTTTSPNPSGTGTTTTPGYTSYTFVDRGHISLEGGVFELLPFSSGVSPATTVTFTDFAGTGRSPYPSSYTTPASNDNGGVQLCGAVANVEVEHSYELGPMVVAPSSDGLFGTAAVGVGETTNANGDPATTPASITENPWTAYFGDTHGPAVPKFSVDTSVTSVGGGVTNHGPETRISELYTVGGTLSFTSASSPAAVYTVHTGAIEFEIVPDTEAIIKDGNISKTDTGTASWAAGQDRTMTVTTSSAHGLTDQYNRVYISGSSNNAMNGLWNVATVTGTTSFTVKLFAAQCGPSAITSSVNVVTYDGIDKKGGVLRSQTGTVNTIQKVVYFISGGTDGNGNPLPDSHNIDYRYTGPHGLGSSGTVTASVSGSGYAGGTHGTNPIPAGDFTGSVTINSGTQFTRRVATGLAGGSGSPSGQVSALASSFTASTFNAGNDIEVVAGGMAGNNQVILKGMTTVDPSKSYSFHGNTTSSQVSVITFTGKTSLTSMFGKAGFKLNTTTGRVFTEGAPSSQPSGTDGMPGGFDPNTNPDGGVKEIDSWCPRYMHAKAKALERNDTQELLKANTSGQHDIDQLLESPMVDENSNITTFLTPRERFQETCWFNIRALKRRDHRRTNTFVENEDWIDRQFGINVYTNPSSDRNEIILDYIDQTNKTEVANTDTAFVIDGEPVTNEQHLNAGYANGNFTNQ